MAAWLLDVGKLLPTLLK